MEFDAALQWIGVRLAYHGIFSLFCHSMTADSGEFDNVQEQERDGKLTGVVAKPGDSAWVKVGRQIGGAWVVGQGSISNSDMSGENSAGHRSSIFAIIFLSAKK